MIELKTEEKKKVSIADWFVKHNFPIDVYSFWCYTVQTYDMFPKKIVDIQIGFSNGQRNRFTLRPTSETFLHK